MGSRSTHNFDFMRAALATAVIFSHSYDMLGRPNPFKQATSGQTELASVAVDLFFILS
jgi:peptidoglycan/LPS O-acetylase OafA/YrhL